MKRGKKTRVTTPPSKAPRDARIPAVGYKPTVPFRKTYRRSDIESLQKGDALFRHFHVLFDVVVLDPASLRRRKDFFPVDGALSYRHNGLCLRVPVLQVH